jgi:hypothetical protein
MFDTYEPEPPLPCPVCGGASLGWQGKDGPCALFLWRQGHRHPVDQPIDEDARIDPQRYAEFTLPQTFALLGWCAQDHQYGATGHAPEGTWTTTTMN